MKNLREPRSPAAKGGEHYFTKTPTSVKRYSELSLFFNNRFIPLKTSTGVFSPKAIDNATLLLIDNMRVGKKVLDMGCGYGPIGIAAAIAKPDCDVTMAEINERAADLARENLSLNNINNAIVVESDFFENVPDKFDTIVMNPPMAIGMNRLMALISECKEHLLPKGTLQVVSRHNKGGSRLHDRMEEVFGNVETIAKGGGFRVYMSVNSK